MIKQICGISCSRIIIFTYMLALAYCLLYLVGCGPALSSAKKIKEFEKAGPITSEVVINASGEPETRLGPYRIVPGDLLDLQIPPVVRIVSSGVSGLVQADLNTGIRPYSCRVNDDGNITLPIVGEMVVADKTVAEIEAMIVDAYYPKYVVNAPMVVCEVAKYKNENERVFTIIGLVRRPDTYPYPPDVQYKVLKYALLCKYRWLKYL